MRLIRHGLAILLLIYFALAVLVSCAKTHSVEFSDDACIKPYKRYDYHTCEDMHVKIDGKFYIIPKNFKTDLASVPRPFWSFISPQYSGFVAPAILHDYLYRCGDSGHRKFADEVLYSALLSEGVTRLTAIKFYIGVRLFGWTHYGHSDESCYQGMIWTN